MSAPLLFVAEEVQLEIEIEISLHPGAAGDREEKEDGYPEDWEASRTRPVCGANRRNAVSQDPDIGRFGSVHPISG